ncbi:membrane bound L-sorbosone dehydrogenase [Variibacter gotjawalensis]|uniref:Membrane bound L-sorbosone dehydrogenase n=1 Tax=Variibacter gotjawalensis TaxID=1333996 RepID=A0A0S3Q0W8_9BRAD|nr:glucose/arabinose dehydrogenase [Variibacter gotjawalensis]BAT61849.1 membrane bound L-sorbosone dehydrogenase [Variibacter gotjawalensis]
MATICNQTTRRAAILGLLIALSACGDTAKLTDNESIGENPTLPAPNGQTIPTVNIAPARGWQDGGMPTAAAGMKVVAFARDLDHPRWIYVLPNGDVLIAETNAPKREGGGIRGWIMGKIMARAGAGTPSANRITLLRDQDGDGFAEIRSVFLAGLNSPFGMALVGSNLYIANTDAIVRVRYEEGATVIKEAPVKFVDLPGGPINHHWTKGLVANREGNKLYASIGSNSNAGENGIANEERRAAILEIDLPSGATRIFASGLRNPVGMAWQPQTGELWTVANERDEIGSDLVPDYLTSVKRDAFMAGLIATMANTSTVVRSRRVRI